MESAELTAAKNAARGEAAGLSEELDRLSADRDVRVVEVQVVTTNRDVRVEEFSARTAERDARLEELSARTVERGAGVTVIVELNGRLTEFTEQVIELREARGHVEAMGKWLRAEMRENAQGRQVLYQDRRDIVIRAQFAAICVTRTFIRDA